MASLGVFSCLLLESSQEIIDYFIQIDLIPICLKILKYGTDIMQTVSAFILDKIITNSHGLESICSDIEKISSVVKVFNSVVAKLSKHFIPNLSKYIVSSFTTLIQKDKVKPIIIENWNKSFANLQASDSYSEEFVKLLHLLEKPWQNANAYISNELNS